MLSRLAVVRLAARPVLRQHSKRQVYSDGWRPPKRLRPELRPGTLSEGGPQRGSTTSTFYGDAETFWDAIRWVETRNEALFVGACVFFASMGGLYYLCFGDYLGNFINQNQINTARECSGQHKTAFLERYEPILDQYPEVSELDKQMFRNMAEDGHWHAYERSLSHKNSQLPLLDYPEHEAHFNPLDMFYSMSGDWHSDEGDSASMLSDVHYEALAEHIRGRGGEPMTMKEVAEEGKQFKSVWEQFVGASVSKNEQLDVFLHNMAVRHGRRQVSHETGPAPTVSEDEKSEHSVQDMLLRMQLKEEGRL